MFRQITNLNGDENYLLFSLVMFFIFFVVVTIALIKMKKTYIDYMGDLPIEDEDRENNTQEPVK